MFGNAEIGIDLGTANILVYTPTKGVIFNEPTLVAVNTKNNQIVAIGHEAKDMVGKTPSHIAIVRPLQHGVIANFDITNSLLLMIMKKISKVVGFSLRKPDVVICTPSGATNVERKAIHDVIKSSGAKNVYLIEEPVAAAIGANLPVDEPVGNVIVDIGGGTTEVAIISYGGVVSSNINRIGGIVLDENIMQYVRKKYNLLIGEATAENIKIEIGYAPITCENRVMDIRGRDLVTGLPKTIQLSVHEIQKALRESLLQILESIRVTLETSPPELSGDIVERGIVLTGGGSLLQGMQEWLSEELFVPVHLAPTPLESVAIGTGQSVKFMKKLKTTI